VTSIPLETRPEDEAVTPAWSPLRRFLFRFAFCYLILQLIPAYLDLLNSIPHADIGGWYMDLWSAAVPWIGLHVLHVKAPFNLTGSSDSMFGWVETLCFLALSLAVALIWTLLDRRRTQYARLYDGLRVFVRIGLGIVMIGYGASKVVPTQFPRPPLSRLMQPFGDASPMGLLWTFMGASIPYSIFSGLLELASGVSLLFRRTATLGALVATAVLTNVVALNFCYDVPVKLLSAHLLAYAVFLAAPDLRRLWDLLVLRRPVVPRADRPFFHRRWARIAALALQGVMAVGYTGDQMYNGYQYWKLYEGSVQTPLYGIWRVDDLRIDGHGRDAQTADGLRWQNLIFDFPGVMAVQSPNESRRPYTLELDAVRKTLALTWPPDPKWKSLLSYGQPAPDHLTMAGMFDGHRVQASLHLVDSAKIPLVSRPFRWVSPSPYNR
jgi:hypothetical protein